VLVRGRVHRGAAGRIRLVVQREAAGGWHDVRRSGTALSARGRFRRVFGGLRRGHYRVHARYLSRTGSLTARSSERLRIRR
jgi:hypothetical protein